MVRVASAGVWEYVGVRVGLVRVIAAEDHGTAMPFLECSPRSSGACARWCCHLTLPYVFPPLPSHGAGEWGEGGVAAAIRSVASRVRPRFSSESMKFYLGKKHVSACLTRKNLDGPFSWGGPVPSGRKNIWPCAVGVLFPSRFCACGSIGPAEFASRPNPGGLVSMPPAGRAAVRV